MKILLTGATGMLGAYLGKVFNDDDDVITLQRHDADIICDLSKDEPDFGDKKFNLVVHAAGTADDSEAFELNLEGTRRLLASLVDNPPAEFVYVSSWEVYSQDSGEDVDESHQLWASTKVGQSKARAEELVRQWCDAREVKLTIIRPARMFGKGITGEMARLFGDVVNSRYIHVRGNDARLSLVCASDVAEAIKKLHSIGGIYNVTDGVGSTWIELAEAMSANSGAMKRQTVLPEKWASLAWKVASWIPAVKASLSPETLAGRSKTLTFSDAVLRSTITDWKPYPAIEVISRECKDYPYLDPVS